MTIGSDNRNTWKAKISNTRNYIPLCFFIALIAFQTGPALGMDTKVPFLDMNGVEQIQVNKNILSFINPNGTLIFDTLNQSWILKSKDKDQHKSTKPFTFPDWVPSSTHRIIKDQVVIRGNSIWLTAAAGEGSIYTSDEIIDNQNRVIYRIPYQNTQNISIQNDSIWLGHPRGITQINRVSRQRIDYELEPKFGEITGWVKFNENYFISTSDGQLFSFNPESGETRSLPFSRYSFDTLFISLESKKDIKRAKFYFTNPILRGSFLTVGVIPTDLSDRSILGESGYITFDLDNLENSGIVRNLGLDSSGVVMKHVSNLGIKKLVKINNDIFLLGNRREFYEGGEFSESGGVVLLNEIGRRFDLPKCSNKPIVAIQAHANNQISILQQSLDPRTDKFVYFECTLVLNEPNPNVSVAEDFARVTRTVRVLERVKLQENDPKIKNYEFLQFELTTHEMHELINGWNVIPKLKAYYNRPLDTKDYHSPWYQDIEGVLHPQDSQQFLDLN